MADRHHSKGYAPLLGNYQAYLGFREDANKHANYYNGINYTWMILSCLTLAITVVIQFVIGINSFSGVEFAYTWVNGFTIMYSISAFLAVAFTLLLFLSLRGSHHRDGIRVLTGGVSILDKPWQVKQSEFAVVLGLFLVAVITSIPLIVYNAKIGNLRTVCDSSFCDVRALIFGEQIFSLMWLSMGATLVLFIKTVWLVYNIDVDVITVDNETIKDIMSRKNGN